jgi:hypothetical protein
MGESGTHYGTERPLEVHRSRHMSQRTTPPFLPRTQLPRTSNSDGTLATWTAGGHMVALAACRDPFRAIGRIDKLRN